MKPRNSNVLIKRFPASQDKVKSSIIHIPETGLKEYSWVSEVVSVGPGEYMVDAQGDQYREEMYVNPGDKVLCWPGYLDMPGPDKDTFFVDISMIDGVIEE